MPATVRKQGDKYRVVESGSGELVSKDGSPVDGGGHDSRQDALDQAAAINVNEGSN